MLIFFWKPKPFSWYSVDFSPEAKARYVQPSCHSSRVWWMDRQNGSVKRVGMSRTCVVCTNCFYNCLSWLSYMRRSSSGWKATQWRHCGCHSDVDKMEEVAWSKRAIRSSEKRRILLTSVKFSTDTRPTTERVSTVPAVTSPSAVAGAKQRGQQQQQQQQPGSGKTPAVSLSIIIVITVSMVRS